jgi:hypothetical protein
MLSAVEQQSKEVVGDIAAASFSQRSDIRKLCKVEALLATLNCRQ